MLFADEAPPRTCLAGAALCVDPASAFDEDLIGDFERS
jgi:hypothetical protein